MISNFRHKKNDANRFFPSVKYLALTYHAHHIICEKHHCFLFFQWLRTDVIDIIIVRLSVRSKRYVRLIKRLKDRNCTLYTVHSKPGKLNNPSTRYGYYSNNFDFISSIISKSTGGEIKVSLFHSIHSFIQLKNIEHPTVPRLTKRHCVLCVSSPPSISLLFNFDSFQH